MVSIPVGDLNMQGFSKEQTTTKLNKYLTINDKNENSIQNENFYVFRYGYA